MQAKTWRVSDLVGQLEPDPWRHAEGFSDDMEQCQAVLFDPETTRREKQVALSKWLSASQPCLFGQMEAKQDRLAFCVLTDNDLERSDQELRARIEQERSAWKRRALKGESHGFLIVAVSRAIAYSRPGPVLHQLAARLCELYLGRDSSDEIHHDDLVLETNVDGKPGWRAWKVGVNYFSAQGDKRWWHDHRIPGGMAFSMNSVGHMARKIAERALSKNPSLIPADVPREKLVYWALRIAMKTIGPPQPDKRRGTWLAERGTFEEDREPPTFEQRQKYFGELAGFSENRYMGLYHTDHTIPSDYFKEDLWRREDLNERDDLYFTYLHRPTDDDYLTMGLGEEIEKMGGSEQ